jgi:hypothetical protein
VTMCTIVFGFFAVLIARELPGRTRVWPYLLAGVVTTAVGFARLYLGAHWPSDLVGGTLFGILWLLILGIAYRRHVARSFWMRPLAWLFYSTFVIAALWHAPRSADALLAKFAAATPTTVMAQDEWWQQGWTDLPATRNERDQRRRWPLDLQVAGPLAPLQVRLQAQGWRVQPQANWVDTVGLLDDDKPTQRQPVLPATLDAQAETLLMLRDGDHKDEQYALRLWPAPVLLGDGTPLWLGSTQTLHLTKPLGAAALWLPASDDGHAHALVAEALKGLESQQSAHPHGATQVLRVKTAGKQ